MVSKEGQPNQAETKQNKKRKDSEVGTIRESVPVLHLGV